MEKEEENMTESRVALFHEIDAERQKQDAKWGEQNHPIRRECDEPFYLSARAHFQSVCEEKARNGSLTWYDILMEEIFEAFAEDSITRQREELVQAVAVGVSMIECLDRKAIIQAVERR